MRLKTIKYIDELNSIKKFLKLKEFDLINKSSPRISTCSKYLHYILQKYKPIILLIIENINNLNKSTKDAIINLANCQSDKTITYSWEVFDESLTDDIFEYFLCMTYSKTLDVVHDAWALSKLFRFYRFHKQIRVKVYVPLKVDYTLKYGQENNFDLTFYIESHRLSQFVKFDNLPFKEQLKDMPILHILVASNNGEDFNANYCLH